MCGINTASGSIHNQIIQHFKFKSVYDYDELRNLFFNQMRKIPIPDVERESNYTHHIVRFASSVIKTWVMPSEAIKQLFKEFSIDPKANRQTRITCMVGLVFSAWHEQDIQKVQLYKTLVGHYLREELPGHPLIVYNDINNLHNTVLILCTGQICMCLLLMLTICGSC